MKILFVFPTVLDDRQRPVKFKHSLMPPLSIAVLDGLTPRRHEVHVADDMVEEIDFSQSYDLVGITAMTFQAPRAYQIAESFRARGVKVIMGGVHVSAAPDEAAQHVDSVAIGEVDNLWERILEDCENGRMKRRYQDEVFPDLTGAAAPRWDHFDLRHYVKIGKGPCMSLFTSRGCPMGCKFCSVTRFFGKTFRTKPIAKVLEEIAAAAADYFFFTDDNVAFDPDYCRELCRAVAPKGIRWSSQISTLVLKHPDLIELAGKSGCVELLVGLESVNPASLKAVNKGFNKIEHYEELIARMHKAGISVLGSFIFGFDEDTPDQFRLTLEFLKKNRVTRALFYVLTPMPGTKLFAEMQEQGRLKHCDWSHYNGMNLVFRLNNGAFSEEQFVRSFKNMYRDFYSWRNILSHAWFTARHIRPERRIREFFESTAASVYYRNVPAGSIEGGIKPIRPRREPKEIANA